ncbi:metallo-beta-lactamase superfamily protein [Synechococcus sp. PCC 7335]|uniref:MBL fold metallo-hydrolase n=1 Tax=Synechococcus sp. (strain ATCC 29403 / PCC 7335) TaxID=91464 RepID=UPI00017EE49D|nr:MBL fold metallo-hydrolase [Synechococcus sp. PCC 7335]EDX83254.1 metallo-beta-lactamase superfamily protein [Synechococcus sp. PCC 7335]
MREQRRLNALVAGLTSYISRRCRRWQLLVIVAGLTLGLVLLGNGAPLRGSDFAIAQTPPADSAETTPEMSPTNAGVYHFKVGDFNAMVVSDGTLSFPAGFFVPNADPNAVTAVLTEHFLSTEDIFAHVNALYVETDEHTVLIDTGAGNSFGPTAGHLLENLDAAGVAAADIDTVILTHAHPDHIGGILDAEGQLRFPNAQFYLSQAESDFWTADSVELPKSLLDEETKAGLIAAAKENLSVIGDRTTLFAMGDEVIPHIQAVNSAGHTPGQASFLITSGEDSLLSTGDVFFSDPLNLENPDWEVAFDGDPEQGVIARRDLLETVTAERRLLLVPHMPFPGLGHVRTQGDAYGWEPIVWQFAV